jgi:hypothetical protein
MKNTPRHVTGHRNWTNAAGVRGRAHATEYRGRAFLDLFVLSGFIAGFFYGFLNPLYISVILARLDTRVIALGSFMSSAFPVLIGFVLGNRKIFGKLYAALPVVMLVELAAAFGAALVAARGPPGVLPGIDVRPGGLFILCRLSSAEDQGSALPLEQGCVRPALRDGGRTGSADRLGAQHRGVFPAAGYADHSTPGVPADRGRFPAFHPPAPQGARAKKTARR